MHILERPDKSPVANIFLSNNPVFNKHLAADMGLQGDIQVQAFEIAASIHGTRHAYAAVRHGHETHAAVIELNYSPSATTNSVGFKACMEGPLALDRDLVDAPPTIMRELSPARGVAPGGESAETRIAWRQAALSAMVHRAVSYHPSGGDVVFLARGVCNSNAPPCHIFLIDDPRSTYAVGVDGDLYALSRHQLAQSVPIPMPPLEKHHAEALPVETDPSIEFASNIWKRKPFGVLINRSGVQQVASLLKSERSMADRTQQTIADAGDPATFDIQAFVQHAVRNHAERNRRVVERVLAGTYGITYDKEVISQLDQRIGGQSAPIRPLERTVNNDSTRRHIPRSQGIQGASGTPGP